MVVRTPLQIGASVDSKSVSVAKKKCVICRRMTSEEFYALLDEYEWESKWTDAILNASTGIGGRIAKRYSGTVY